ncbi:hypothetical protein M378DRAFT_16735 [Amanita muscaria Koide BX008]|uniref:Uncharacterized protein n=1 Tax=Amanita muscaria (strain Koide BX008) TaxID=946122 RepID=A0A0C2W6R5_AMAMK|nr:hypothetical protein M378DRAFT_16735 [Amanita muscaria Koide BX008]
MFLTLSLVAAHFMVKTSILNPQRTKPLRFAPLWVKEDTASLVNFDHESISTASIASNDKVNLPPSSSHTTEEDPFRLVTPTQNHSKMRKISARSLQEVGFIQLRVLVDLSKLLRFLHTERSKGSLHFTSKVSKHVRLGHSVIKKLDDTLKEIARISPEYTSSSQQRIQEAVLELIDSDMDFTSNADSVANKEDMQECVIKEEVLSQHELLSQHEDESQSPNQWIPNRELPHPSRLSREDPEVLLSMRHQDQSIVTVLRPQQNLILRSHAQHAHLPPPHQASVEIPLPSTQTHAANVNQELETLIIQKENERKQAQEKHHLLQEERAKLEAAATKQLELDKERERQQDLSSIEGTPKFQSDQLRTMYEQFTRERQNQSEGVGTSKGKKRDPTFSSNFDNLQDMVNSPTLRAIKVKDNYLFAPIIVYFT